MITKLARSLCLELYSFNLIYKNAKLSGIKIRLKDRYIDKCCDKIRDSSGKINKVSVGFQSRLSCFIQTIADWFETSKWESIVLINNKSDEISNYALVDITISAAPTSQFRNRITKFFELLK